MSAVLPPDTVCACLLEKGSRQVRVFERCEDCGALMESDLPADLDAALRVVSAAREVERILRQSGVTDSRIADLRTALAALSSEDATRPTPAWPGAGPDESDYSVETP